MSTAMGSLYSILSLSLVSALALVPPSAPIHAQETSQSQREAMQCPTEPIATVTQAGMDPQRLSRIPARMKQFVETGRIAGAVMLVARHGIVVCLEAVGYQELETQTPMPTDAIFQIRSMTKPVTAVAIMILVEEGRLLLRDPVEKHLPKFRGQMVIESRDGDRVLSSKPPSRPITIRDLLTHTSGMGSWRAYVNSNPGPRAMMTLAEVVGIYSQKPLEFEPGTQWSYSDPGIVILGRIIEVVSEQPYERFVHERIFKPLGMKDSFFFPPAEKRHRRTTGYSLRDGTLSKSNGDLYPEGARFASPAAGMNSTASDMAVFCQMMLNGGSYNGVRILSRSSVDMMTAVHVGDLQPGWAGMGWGLGWRVVREPMGTLSLASVGAFAMGSGRGYGWVDPAKDLVGVLLFDGYRAFEVRDTFMAMAAAAIID